MNFKPTFLYIKQHSLTGLKYFGKTTKADPEKYTGSGIVWLEHIKENGKENIETLWYQLFTDEDKIKDYATKFSLENNIVESKEWANSKLENGLDGGSPKGRVVSAIRRSKLTGQKRSEEVKKKMSDVATGKPKSEEHARNIGLGHVGLKRTDETKKRMSERQKDVPKSQEHIERIKASKNSPEGKQRMKDAWDLRRLKKSKIPVISH